MTEVDEYDWVKDIAARLEAAEITNLYRQFHLSGEAVQDPSMGGKYVFADVAESCVDATLRVAVHKAVRWATGDLLLGAVPTVRWFVPESEADRAHVRRWGVRDWDFISNRKLLDGYTFRGQALADPALVWINATLTPARAIAVAAHECRHLEQHPRMQDAEADACEYEARVRRRILHACL